jgi:hypothetical protein
MVHYAAPMESGCEKGVLQDDFHTSRASPESKVS